MFLFDKFERLCIVTDVFGIFAALSWAFYNPGSFDLPLLGYVWLYKALITDAPVVFVAATSAFVLIGGQPL